MLCNTYSISGLDFLPIEHFLSSKNTYNTSIKKRSHFRLQLPPFNQVSVTSWFRIENKFWRKHTVRPN